MMLDYQANSLSAMQKNEYEMQRAREQDTVFNRLVARQEREGIKGLNIALAGRLRVYANREELKSIIEEKEGNFVSSVTENVDYLIMNNPEYDSANARKAKELGIEIISEFRFNEITGLAFVIECNELTRYSGTGGDVAIPEGVESIGAQAFANCLSLTSVTIPEGVSSIGKYAFIGCVNLKRATIPSSVKSIQLRAFNGCHQLMICAQAKSFAAKYARRRGIPCSVE